MFADVFVLRAFICVFTSTGSYLFVTSFADTLETSWYVLAYCVGILTTHWVPFTFVQIYTSGAFLDKAWITLARIVSISDGDTFSIFTAWLCHADILYFASCSCSLVALVTLAPIRSYSVHTVGVKDVCTRAAIQTFIHILTLVVDPFEPRFAIATNATIDISTHCVISTRVVHLA
jgi:hypothetical protein